MREVVRASFVAFTTPMEGCVSWLYADVKNLVTVAIGNLVDPIQVALTLPFVRKDGSAASRDEIATDWLRVKNDPQSARLGHKYTEKLTALRLTLDGINLVVSRKLSQMDQHLAGRFPDYEDWPACGQLAVLSQSWACGPAFNFPKMEEALRARDFAIAAEHCTIREAGNPGVIPRNVANRILLHNAQRVADFKLDPDLLDWKQKLGVSGVDTQPDMAALSKSEPPSEPTPAPAGSYAAAIEGLSKAAKSNTASSPTCFPPAVDTLSGIVHPVPDTVTEAQRRDEEK